MDSGFLLPPLQTLEGAQQAAANIRALAQGLQVPFAVENKRQLPAPGRWRTAFLQSQFSLHSGHLLGIPGRLLVALSSLVVAMLSVTGT